ncbi:hypothetical protein [Alkalihalobacillus trypoxylicola]|nr:hypothetical protein [Alkalihalobacillus trypoxylicola]
MRKKDKKKKEKNQVIKELLKKNLKGLKVKGNNQARPSFNKTIA